MRMRSMIALGVAVTMMLVWSTSASADSPWEDVEIQPGDSTWCEFEPGVITVYEVDESTLPRFDRFLQIVNELPDGTVRSHLVFRRYAVQFLKLDPAAPGPDVLIEWQSASLTEVTTSAGDTLSLRATLNLVQRTPDGRLVDLNHQRWDGRDAYGDPIIVSQTGVCLP